MDGAGGNAAGGVHAMQDHVLDVEPPGNYHREVFETTVRFKQQVVANRPFEFYIPVAQYDLWINHDRRMEIARNGVAWRPEEMEWVMSDVKITNVLGQVAANSSIPIAQYNVGLSRLKVETMATGERVTAFENPVTDRNMIDVLIQQTQVGVITAGFPSTQMFWGSRSLPNDGTPQINRDRALRLPMQSEMWEKKNALPDVELFRYKWHAKCGMHRDMAELIYPRDIEISDIPFVTVVGDAVMPGAGPNLYGALYQSNFIKATGYANIPFDYRNGSYNMPLVNFWDDWPANDRLKVIQNHTYNVKDYTYDNQERHIIAKNILNVDGAPILSEDWVTAGRLFNQNSPSYNVAINPYDPNIGQKQQWKDSITMHLTNEGTTPVQSHFTWAQMAPQKRPRLVPFVSDHKIKDAIFKIDVQMRDNEVQPIFVQGQFSIKYTIAVYSTQMPAQPKYNYLNVVQHLSNTEGTTCDAPLYSYTNQPDVPIDGAVATSNWWMNVYQKIYIPNIGLEPTAIVGQTIVDADVLPEDATLKKKSRKTYFKERNVQPYHLRSTIKINKD